VVILFIAAVVGGIWPDPIAALIGAETEYDITLKKGVSKTTMGDAFPFTGKGTMTVNEGTGEFSYSIKLSNGLTFEGSGDIARTSKDEVFGTATTVSGGLAGTIIITGKVKKGGAKFAGGKLYAAVPNRLGAPPDGFVYTTAKLTGKRQ
jgi:hypothetical protein